MSLSNISISFVTRFIMNDLNNYLEGREEYLTSDARIDIEGWFEWATDTSVTYEDKEIMLEEIHNGLQFMSIWSYDIDDQREYIQMIQKYFAEKFNKDESVNKFSHIVLNYYKEELESF